MSFLSKSDQNAVEAEYTHLRQAPWLCRFLHRWSRWAVINSGDLVSRAFWLTPEGPVPTNEVMGKWFEYRRECCGCGLIQTKYNRQDWRK